MLFAELFVLLYVVIMLGFIINTLFKELRYKRQSRYERIPTNEVIKLDDKQLVMNDEMAIKDIPKRKKNRQSLIKKRVKLTKYYYQEGNKIPKHKMVNIYGANREALNFEHHRKQLLYNRGEL